MNLGRYSALATNTFDNNARGSCQAVLRGTILAIRSAVPIMKDKLFFFQSTEWLRVRSSATAIINIPRPQLIATANSNTQQFFNAFGTLRSNFIQLKTYTRDQLAAAGITAARLRPARAIQTSPSAARRQCSAQGQYSVPAIPELVLPKYVLRRGAGRIGTSLQRLNCMGATRWKRATCSPAP